MRDIFRNHYSANFWQNEESASGHGSTLDATRNLIETLPVVWGMFDIQSILDIPCGDWNWGYHVAWPETYIGADIVDELIFHNQAKYPHIDFRVLDIVEDDLPEVDAIFCRDLLGHFSDHDVKLALANIKSSGAKYLIATTFPEWLETDDIETGQWRPINLAHLHGLPDPKAILFESHWPDFGPKCLGIWDLRS